MANFSALFPNLQSNLDFVDVDGGTDDGNGSSGKVVYWAESDDSSVIPTNKLPNFSTGNIFTGTSTQTGDANALDSFIAAFDAAGVATEGITVAVGETISAGDRAILTDAGGETEIWIYIGADVTADATASSGQIVAGDFRDLSHTGDVVDTLQAGTSTNIVLSGGTDLGAGVRVGAVTVDLDADITGITSINGGADTTALTIGNSATTTLGLATTGELDATAGSVDINSAGNITADTTNGSIEMNAAGANGSFSLNANTSGVITASSNLSLTAIASELRVSGTGITAGTDAAPNVIGVGADGRLQTVNVEVGGGPLSERYAYGATTDTGAHTQAAFNTVVYVPTQSQQQIITLSDGTAPDNGTWLKVINNSGRADLRVNTTQGFLGTGDTFVIFDDTTANVEFIYTTDGWAIIAS